uniref:Uncharacterized protein n=1 Tax=Oryza glaberrima TaxID=4538 RepID=I1QMD8_ORYGL
MASVGSGSGGAALGRVGCTSLVSGCGYGNGGRTARVLDPAAPTSGGCKGRPKTVDRTAKIECEMLEEQQGKLAHGQDGAPRRRCSRHGAQCSLPHQDKGESKVALPAREKAKGGGGKGALPPSILGGGAGVACRSSVTMLVACGMWSRGRGDNGG